MRGGRDGCVAAGCRRQRPQLIGWLSGVVYLDFSSDASRLEHVVGGDGITFDGTWEILAPLLDLAGLSVNPVKMRLEVAVGGLGIAVANNEENVARVAGPVQTFVDSLVVGDAAGFGRCVSVAGGSRRCGGSCQIEHTDLDVLVSFLTLVDRVGDECEFRPIG